jgi:prepilin-type N-terminal cleavage/methylation domain-containing protein
MRNADTRGFTLIEVMTVVALIVIMAGFASRGGTSAKDTIALEREANKLADIIRTARQNSYAITGASGGFAPSHGVGISTGGSISLYTVDVSVADMDEKLPNPKYKDLLCTSSGTDNYTLGGGIQINTVQFQSGNGGLQGADGTRIVFVRPLPTTYMISCSGGKPVRGSGELQIILENRNGNQRMVSVNSVGKIEVSVPPQP